MATNLVTGLGGPAGFGENVLDTGDFAFAAVDLRPVFARGLTLFGATYTQLFVNATGSVSFGGDAKNVNLGALSGAPGVPIFAPFVADVVSGSAGAPSPGGMSTGSNRVWYDLDPATNSFTVTWDDVSGYLADPLANAFQLRITGVPDAAGAYAGDFNVEYRYESMAWTTGGDQGGTDGLGGTPARAGYSAGNGRDYLELPASGNQAALLALDTASNVADPGRFLFQSRAGRIAPVFSADSVRVAEGSAAAPGQALVTVTLSTPLDVAATVRYTTEAGSAAAASDFAPRYGILTFAPGLTTQTVLVDLVGDDVAEGQESFTFALSEPSAGAKAVSGTVTILAEDGGQAPLTLLVTDAQALESNGTVDFVLRLSAPQASAVSGFYAAIDEESSTASAADVTIPETGFFTFAPGQTQITVSVPVLPDAIVEGDEHFSLNFIAGPVEGTFPVRGTIRDDDGFTISDAAVTEAEGATVTFTVSRITPLAEQSTVFWGTSSGTAGAGVDYKGSTGALTFAPGVTSQTITIPILNDTVAELEKQFTVVLSGASKNTGIARGTGTATLADDDGLRIADLSVAEGSNNKFNTVFMSVTLPQAAPAQVTVNYKIEAGTGDPGITDISQNGRSGTLTFAPGQTKADIPVGVIGDSTPEPDETFRVVLSNPGGASGFHISDGSATLTILNDDGVAPLVATIASQTVSEGSNTGTQIVPMTVFLNRLSTQPVEVAWTLLGDNAKGGTATPGIDFVQASGTTTIPAGSLSATIPVEVMRDANIEPDDTLTLRITSLKEGTTPLGTIGPDARLTLANDDTTFTVIYPITSLTEAEWAANPFEVTLDPAPPRKFVPNFGWKVGPGTAPGTVSADAADFVGGVLPLGSAPVGLNNATATIIVPVAHDTAAEPNESFTLTLFDGGVAVGTVSATILTDDVGLSIAATSANKPEGSGPGPTPYTFTVTRTGDLSKATSAKWSAAGTTGSGTVPANAADFADFAGGVLPSGTVSFAPFQKTQLITVNVAADRTVENNERFAVTLASPSAGASITTTTAGAIILNDDTAGTGALSLARLRTSRAEGQSGTTDFTFLVTRAGTTTGTAAVDWTVTGGGIAGTNAAATSDFAAGTLPRGSVSFAAGETSKPVTVQLKADTAVELNESFTVTLGNAAQGVTLATASATGLIWNDDTPGTGTLSIARLAAQKAEGHTGSTAFTFTVTRSGALTGTASADWSVIGGGAANTVPANGADFTGGQLPNGRVSFIAGQASATVTVKVAGDTAAELNESFTIALSGLQAGVALSTAAATGIILNDDFASTAANQTLTGTTGPDVFLIGGGLDTVIGRAGLDQFLFGPAALGNPSINATALNDFSPTAGEKLDLSAIDAIAGAGLANDAFTFIGTAAFTAPGQLRWLDLGTHRAVVGSVDADADAELTIFLAAPGPVTSSWFVL